MEDVPTMCTGQARGCETGMSQPGRQATVCLCCGVCGLWAVVGGQPSQRVVVWCGVCDGRRINVLAS